MAKKTRHRHTLLIFVKNEEAGKVKTRLAASVGEEKALSIYQELLEITTRETQKVDAHKEVWYSRFIPEKDRWDAETFRKNLQHGKNLGERMSNAFKSAFDGGAENVVIIGSDCAELTSGIITSAFEELKESDFVVGPAEDGGYYLLGMREFHPEIFEDIDWSTESVLQETLTKVSDLAKSVTKLAQLNDIDTLDDWEKVKDTL